MTVRFEHQTLHAAPIESTIMQPFTISLAHWSFRRSTFDDDLNPLEIPKLAKDEFGITQAEYVNRQFHKHFNDLDYIPELKKRTEDFGVRNLLMMIDHEGRLGDPDQQAREQAIENHKRYFEPVKELGCHSMRVNAHSEGSPDEQHELLVDGLRRLTELAAPFDLNIIVENHGLLSSDGAWLAGVIRDVDHPNCGTLPDFGNFCLDWSRMDDPTVWRDRYEGVNAMMPFARAVSAKSNDFDEHGNETQTDYRRMMRIVLDAGYRGAVGIEYEGQHLSDIEGVRATKRLLETVRDELKDQYEAVARA